MAPSREPPPRQGIFAYPAGTHEWRHGPCGYVEDENYKPWLRDEFAYRCVYCLSREVWLPDGDGSFSVEHVEPTSRADEGLTSYESLVYACCQCNSGRGAEPLPLDPSGELAGHLEVREDGTIRGLTPAGEDLIRVCRLDRASLTRFRRLVLDILSFLGSDPGDEAAELCRRYLGNPANLPNLAALRPPGGNSRPRGIEESAFARRACGAP